MKTMTTSTIALKNQGRLLCLVLLTFAALARAQFEGPPLGNGPWFFDTYEQDDIRVSVVARGITYPFGMVFLPGTATNDFPLGDILFTERRTGRVRLYQNGELLGEPVGDLKATFPLDQLFDIDLHPQYERNRLLYFAYIKQAPRPDGSEGYYSTTAIARGRWNGDRLTDLEEVFEADGWSTNIGGASSRMHFLADGTLLLGVSHRIDREAPQSLQSHIGKVLRLNDDGTVPADNPFYAVEGALPEIFTWGNRSVMDFATHPETGAIWELENGPQGGDEVNILQPGVNYGWPRATFGRDYDGTLFNPLPWVEGTERPEIFWVPSVTVATMTFYPGDEFPEWNGNLFVTSMIQGRIPGTGHLERVVFNENGEIRREQLLNELEQRIRYVVQGPDDLLYLLTDHSDGVLLRVEPAGTAESQRAPGQGLDEARLFSENDCNVCHRTEAVLVGPSYRDIARRYQADENTIDQLVERIIAGGAGVWGEVPMTPHPDITQETATEMVARILELERE